ncbi:MAG: hypothetical protein EA408_13745 [Marinilabiliales bacterium]|nr:MAG: hypothetical protein EA408_13745 [Marinilabiliales bacterium]
MKKLTLFIAAIFLAMGLYAQQEFIVPEVPVAQKHQRMLSQFDGMLAVGINFAKTQGLTAAEYGSLIGEQFKYSWNKEAGFEGFVKGMLYNASCFLVDPGTEITINTAEKVKFKTRLWAASIKVNEPVYGVTYTECMDFFNAMAGKIGDYLGANYDGSYDDEWVYFTITKKN